MPHDIPFLGQRHKSNTCHQNSDFSTFAYGQNSYFSRPSLQEKVALTEIKKILCVCLVRQFQLGLTIDFESITAVEEYNGLRWFSPLILPLATAT